MRIGIAVGLLGLVFACESSAPKRAPRTQYVSAFDEEEQQVAPLLARPPATSPEPEPERDPLEPPPAEPREWTPMPQPQAARPEPQPPPVPAQPAHDPNECYCAVSGEWPVLCASPRLPRCRCVSYVGTVCSDRHVQRLCPNGYETIGPADRKSGQPCSGWAFDLDGREKPVSDGQLMCEVCYAPSPSKDAKAGTACSGVDPEGNARSGVYVCGKGIPRPPDLGKVPMKPADTF